MLPTKFWFIWSRRFQRRRFFRNQPLRNKNGLWRPCFLTDRDEMRNLYRGPSIDASYQVSVHLAQGFQRRRLKCEKLTDDGRQVMAKAHIALGKVSKQKKTRFFYNVYRGNGYKKCAMHSKISICVGIYTPIMCFMHTQIQYMHRSQQLLINLHYISSSSSSLVPKTLSQPSYSSWSAFICSK